jgi:hypothetical protein
MGATYTFHLGFPADRAADVFRAIAAMADPAGESRVRLPDGSTLVVPFTVHLQPADVMIGAEAWTTLDTVLWLPVDEPVRALVTVRGAADPLHPYRWRRGEGAQEVALGYVYLTVGVGARYALFSFTAPTTEYSRLFAESAAIRGRFQRLLTENGGLVGLFDQHGPPFPLLPDLTRHVAPDADVLAGADADAWVEAALAALERAG